MSVVGARPQFVKLAPVAQAFGRSGHEHVIVHTGQHYDALLSEVFFADLEIPAPDVHLGVGSGSHGVQTGSMLAALDSVIDEHRPDWVLVYGDTNSTLAGALSAVKLHVPIAHLEAGLRSFNRRMPEEHNRVLTDHAADLLLAPTRAAIAHLTQEGLGDRAILVGDVMTDVCLRVRDAVEGKPLPDILPDDLVGGPFLVATLHRAENTDDHERLHDVIRAMADLPVPVLLLAHPRLVARAQEQGLPLERGAIRLGRPLPYPQMVAAILASAGVLTDSGGLQKESFLLDRLCTTLRTETEWAETLEHGWNVLVDDLARLSELVGRAVPTGSKPAPYGDGTAAFQVIRALESGVPSGARHVEL